MAAEDVTHPCQTTGYRSGLMEKLVPSGLVFVDCGKVSQRHALLVCILCPFQCILHAVLPWPFSLEELPHFRASAHAVFLHRMKTLPIPFPTSESPVESGY